MTSFDYTGILTQAVDELSDSQSYKGLFHQHKDGAPLPSAKSLYKIVELARSILFPGYFGNSTINSHTITYHIGVNVENLFDLLPDQIQAGLCFGQENNNNDNTNNNVPCRETAAVLAARFISKLPEMRRILATDVEAAYYGDPAATCFGEIISCYPAIRAISNREHGGHCHGHLSGRGIAANAAVGGGRERDTGSAGAAGCVNSVGSGCGNYERSDHADRKDERDSLLKVFHCKLLLMF